MTNDQNTPPQSLKDQIQALMAEVQKSNKESAIENKKTSDELDAIKKDFDTAADGVEKDLAELDVVEKETGDQLDKLILENAEDSGGDEL